MDSNHALVFVNKIAATKVCVSPYIYCIFLHRIGVNSACGKMSNDME